jgi:hypothetical protein
MKPAAPMIDAAFVASVRTDGSSAIAASAAAKASGSLSAMEATRVTVAV